MQQLHRIIFGIYSVLFDIVLLIPHNALFSATRTHTYKHIQTYTKTQMDLFKGEPLDLLTRVSLRAPPQPTTTTNDDDDPTTSSKTTELDLIALKFQRIVHLLLTSPVPPFISTNPPLPSKHPSLDYPYNNSDVASAPSLLPRPVPPLLPVRSCLGCFGSSHSGSGPV